MLIFFANFVQLGQIKSILGRCVHHDEYMDPIDLGRGQRSSEVNRGQTLKILVIQLSPHYLT